MDDTAFFITPAIREQLAKVHRRDPDDSLSPDMAFEIPQQPRSEVLGMSESFVPGHTSIRSAECASVAGARRRKGLEPK